MKMKLLRQSGLPVVLEHFVSYQKEFSEAYDIILAEAGTDMPTIQKRCDELEATLKDKYALTLEIMIPKNAKAWKKLLTQYGAPILVAQSMDNNNELVMVLMDEVTAG
jgi:hypothetical protein